jgi:hypothetical protein
MKESKFKDYLFSHKQLLEIYAMTYERLMNYIMGYQPPRKFDSDDIGIFECLEETLIDFYKNNINKDSGLVETVFRKNLQEDGVVLKFPWIKTDKEGFCWEFGIELKGINNHSIKLNAEVSLHGERVYIYIKSNNIIEDLNEERIRIVEVPIVPSDFPESINSSIEEFLELKKKNVENQIINFFSVLF